VGTARRLSSFALIVVALLVSLSPAAHAEAETWSDVAEEMATVLATAGETYAAGDAEAAKEQVNTAYYGYYEKEGFEKTVMAYISGDRAAEVEYQFSSIKKAMLAGAAQSEVDAALDTLAEMLRTDAAQLDGKSDNPIWDFLGALIIILREGFEAILVVVAIVAYLVKAGQQAAVRQVYWGVAAALVASVILAWIFGSLSAAAGASQEIFEGVTMIVAVLMLIWVSNWILSKADAKAWSGYIKEKSATALSTGSMLTLALTAFLAVFREGAETIIMYAALLGRAPDSAVPIWVGLGTGLVALLAVYAAIRLLSVRIPLRPFFLATSVLLAVMAVSFAGGGIKELQEGDLVSATPVAGIGSVDLLGFYPTVETLSAQAVALAAIVILGVLGVRRGWGRATEGPPEVTAGSPTGAAPTLTKEKP
jgi:high-affinity iron transporter